MNWHFSINLVKLVVDLTLLIITIFKQESTGFLNIKNLQI